MCLKAPEEVIREAAQAPQVSRQARKRPGFQLIEGAQVYQVGDIVENELGDIVTLRASVTTSGNFPLVYQKAGSYAARAVTLNGRFWETDKTSPYDLKRLVERPDPEVKREEERAARMARTLATPSHWNSPSYPVSTPVVKVETPQGLYQVGDVAKTRDGRIVTLRETPEGRLYYGDPANRDDQCEVTLYGRFLGEGTDSSFDLVELVDRPAQVPREEVMLAPTIPRTGAQEPETKRVRPHESLSREDKITYDWERGPAAEQALRMWQTWTSHHAAAQEIQARFWIDLTLEVIKTRCRRLAKKAKAKNPPKDTK